jgi:hypothetical protein
MDLRASVDDQRLAGEEVTLGRAKEQETPDQALRDFGALQRNNLLDSSHR